MAAPEPETPLPEPPPAWRRRLAPVILVLGFAAAIALLQGRAPADQELVFRLEDDPASVREIEASWTPEGASEASGGVELSFEHAAPRNVRHRVSLPNGRYELAIEVVRKTGGASLSHTTTTRRVNLEGGETVIPLRAR